MNEELAQVHRRRNILNGDWVLVSPHRSRRPWLGAQEAIQERKILNFEPSCPLCPQAERANGVKNPNYEHTFCFVNDFSALHEPGDTQSENEIANINADDLHLFSSQTVSGECRVLCYSANHSKTLADLSVLEIEKVVQQWVSNTAELARRFACVQIFENKGAQMGCSQPHPHGQIWAHSHLPSLVQREHDNQLEYYKSNQRNMLLNYLEKEIEFGHRLVCDNTHWAVLVPYWAAWPYETLLMPKAHVSNICSLDQDQQHALAEILGELAVRYDNLFKCRFPYSMGWHSAPSDCSDEARSAWQLHAHFYPPLLRSASVKKFMVGYEMMAEPQRDILAEDAAKALRTQSTKLYRSR